MGAQEPLVRRQPGLRACAGERGPAQAAAAVTGPVTLAGASLGALAALQAATAAPAAFGALFLQSGSFFRADTDQQESSFPRFAAVTSFVAGLGRAPPEGAVLDIGMTCGLAEENLANNRLMAQTLAGLGHRLQLAAVVPPAGGAAAGQGDPVRARPVGPRRGP